MSDGQSQQYFQHKNDETQKTCGVDEIAFNDVSLAELTQPNNCGKCLHQLISHTSVTSSINNKCLIFSVKLSINCTAVPHHEQDADRQRPFSMNLFVSVKLRFCRHEISP